MLCGNDPAARARLQPGDWAMVRWFDAWLRWSALPDEQRAATPEPIAPGADGGPGWPPPPTTETES